MSIIQDLETRVLDRLEDPEEEFWVSDELRTLIVEGMNEATLVTGDPQVRQSQPTPLITNRNLQPLPFGALLLLRVEGTNSLPINKFFARDLDLLYPAWENDTASEIEAWFPVGLTQFGVYPKLDSKSAQSVILTYVAFPVTSPRPYTGNERVPFQEEFADAFVEYAEHVARLKEGGKEFQQSMAAYQRWLEKVQDMTNFGLRRDRLHFVRPGVVSTFTNVRET